MNKQMVSVSEAARLCGRNRKTLYRDYLKTGRLSSTPDPVTGNKTIAISELIRVFGELTRDVETAETGDTTAPMPQVETPKETEATSDETAELRAELAAAKAEIELLKQTNESLKERIADKDKNLEDLRTITKLIEHKPKKRWFNL